MIVREGYPFIAIGLLIAIVSLKIFGGIGLPTLVIPLYIAFFFRNPNRSVPREVGAIVSPADGRVVSITEVEEGRSLGRKLRKISIFISLFDVHVNRIPYAGRIKEVFYHPGRFFSAFKEKASLQNEQNAIVLECEGGQELAFVQIAGILARRIVCRLSSGESVEKGSPFGLIRFGSRMDVYLPLKAELAIEVGKKVLGGETILARFR